jgi:hypothetical protein
LAERVDFLEIDYSLDFFVGAASVHKILAVLGEIPPLPVAMGIALEQVALFGCSLVFLHLRWQAKATAITGLLKRHRPMLLNIS